MPVYCKNCKHFVGEVAFIDGTVQMACNGRNFSDDFIYTKCRELNKNGYCNVYKRLWYKFWVREVHL